MNIDSSDLTFEAIANVILFGIIFIYLGIPFITQRLWFIFAIFEFIAQFIKLIVYALGGSVVALIAISIIQEIGKRLKISRYDPRIAKDLEF